MKKKSAKRKVVKRRAHMRLLSSDRFTNKKGKTIYVGKMLG